MAQELKLITILTNERALFCRVAASVKVIWNRWLSAVISSMFVLTPLTLRLYSIVIQMYRNNILEIILSICFCIEIHLKNVLVSH